jgi:hypothetical protein
LSGKRKPSTWGTDPRETSSQLPPTTSFFEELRLKEIRRPSDIIRQGRTLLVACGSLPSPFLKVLRLLLLGPWTTHRIKESEYHVLLDGIILMRIQIRILPLPTFKAFPQLFSRNLYVINNELNLPTESTVLLCKEKDYTNYM